MTSAAGGRRCRPRTIEPGARRPSAVLTAFFVPALAMLLAAAGAGVASTITGLPWLHWLALHLALLGGVSQLVLGAGQFFTCAFLASTPPSRGLVTAQLLAWNAGTALVAVGVPTTTTGLTDAGGILVVAGLVLFGVSLRGMQRRSLQRARWAVRWYWACAFCLGIGAVVGIAMARGTPWPHGSLLGAHLALNLAGWMGTAIVGTLHTFFPSLTQTRLRLARLQGPTFASWLLGVAALAIGAATASDALLIAGWIGLAAAATMLSANVLASLIEAAIPLSLAARLVALAQLFLPAGMAIALVSTIADGAQGPFLDPIRGVLGVVLLAGWVGMTVAGSLLHLLAVLARVRSFSLAMPAPRPVRDRLLVAALAAGIAGMALTRYGWIGALSTPAKLLTVAVVIVLAVKVAALAGRAVGIPSSAKPRLTARPT